MNTPPYAVFPELIHLQVLLREVTTADLPALVEISFYDGVGAKSLEEAAAMQEKINADYAAGNSVHWLICNQFTNEVAGTCGYYRGFANNTGELGCVLLPAQRGKGYMTAAMEAAIHYGKNIMGLEKIIAITTPENERAIKLMERLHFEREGEVQNGQITFVQKK